MAIHKRPTEGLTQSQQTQVEEFAQTRRGLDVAFLSTDTGETFASLHITCAASASGSVAHFLLQRVGGWVHVIDGADGLPLLRARRVDSALYAVSRWSPGYSPRKKKLSVEEVAIDRKAELATEARESRWHFSRGKRERDGVLTSGR